MALDRDRLGWPAKDHAVTVVEHESHEGKDQDWNASAVARLKPKADEFALAQAPIIERGRLVTNRR